MSLWGAGTCTYSTEYSGYLSGTALREGVFNSDSAKCLKLCSTTRKCQTAVLATGNTCYLYEELAGARTPGFSYSILDCGDNGTSPQSAICCKLAPHAHAYEDVYMLVSCMLNWQ